VYLIPETKDLGALLAHWRRDSEQFAVVLDESGTAFALNRPRTLAGLVMGRLGHHPQVGEAVEIDGVTIRVQAVDGLRITQLAITLAAGPGEPGLSRGSS
jgi:CBS domain containing-hemolysin-like protein